MSPQDPLALVLEADVMFGVVGSESRYASVDVEMLAVVWALVQVKLFVLVGPA